MFLVICMVGGEKVRLTPRNRLIVGISLLGFFLMTIWFAPRVLFLNLSRSIPRGLYLRVPLGTVKVGETVAYMPTDDVVMLMREREWIADGQEPLPFLKYIGGLPGDSFSAQGHRFFINGKYVGEILDADIKGQALPQLRGEHEIQEWEFLPLASNPNGFDGRYTGCVPFNRIIAKVVPVWVVD